MINLYFKNFNFNISNSIGILLSSASESKNFIKETGRLNINCEIYSFETLKKHFDIDGKIESALHFPFKNLAGFLPAKAVFLYDAAVNSLADAALFNAVCDFALNNEIIFGIITKKGFNCETDFYLHPGFKRNYYENLILDIYRMRLKLLLLTRMIADERNLGYTASIAEFISGIKTIGFNLDKAVSYNNGKSNLIFLNSEKSAVTLNLSPLKSILAPKEPEFVSKNEISLNVNLYDIYFYKNELINKIKIFLNTAKNLPTRIYCRRRNYKTKNRAPSGLSKIQKISIDEIDAAQLVIAGAGSGKTKVIANKFLYLLNFFSADSILVLTFTNNAVNEIKTRIARSLQIDGYNALIIDKILNISTYHSFFYSIIKEFYLELGYKSVPLASDKKGGYDKRGNDVFISYNEIILNMLELFKNDSIVYEIASRFKYILVDEYQDLDFTCDYVIKKLDGGRGKIMHAGDDDQSIYGFNGGDSFNLLLFDLFFPSGKVFVFQNNYRSGSQIVNFCNSILDNISFRYKKKLIAKNREIPDKAVEIFGFENGTDEENFIKKTAVELALKGKKAAVLVRTKKEKSKFLSISGFAGLCSVWTIHGSKGLEFDIVFISGVSKGNIPHIKSIRSAFKNEEYDSNIHPFVKFFKTDGRLNADRDDEIKLFYVAASRAKEKLYISYSGEISDFLKQ